jgi:hypothetical protein
MTEKKRDLFALLIGINYYFPNRLPEGGSYGPLHGAVRDVNQVGAFLKTHLDIPDENILRLTASHGGENGPAEDPAMWPTYENIIGGFHNLMERAGPGDQVVIHYSGHGGRAASIYPTEVKSGGWDEALVPTDIGDEEARYVRDLELAHLLHQMTEEGLIVTTILDCCHSGGLTRGDAVARGIDEQDTTPRPTDTLAADTMDELLATWRQLTGGTRAGTPLTIGGLPASDDWTVMTACRPHELAYEYTFDGRHRSGALTYWLLDALAALEARGTALSYKQLHQHVMARVQSQFSRQRPQLYGDGSRTVFGRTRVRATFAVPVLKVDEARKEVVLNAGVAQGVRRGTQFAIFPLGATDLSDFDNAAAHVTIKQDGATSSQATIDDVTEGATLEPGAQAVLINPASVRLRSNVRLQAEGEGALPAETRATLKTAHADTDSGAFVQWAEGDAPVDFVVAGGEGAFEIWDPGGVVIPRIHPPLPLDDQDAPTKIMERLVHLTRYRNVQQLANNDTRARGAPRVTFEWLDVPQDHIFTEGEIARLFIRNDSDRDVEITVLHLGPDWRIDQFYPPGAADSYTYAPGESDTLELELFVAGDDDVECDIYKVFATYEGTNFRMLELPSLDQPLSRKAGTRAARNALEELLAQVVETAPKTRAGGLRTSAAREWATAQIELRVRRDKE